jgi:hypothetical protein
VRQQQKRNISYLLVQRLVLSGLLLGISFFAISQSPSDADTSRRLSIEMDTTIMPPAAEIVDTVVTIEENYKDEEEEEEKEYFLPHYVTGGGFDSIHQRKISDQLRNSLLKDKDFWYADYEPSPKKPVKMKNSNGVSFFDTGGFQTFLWILIIGGFAAVVMLYLHNNNVRLFRTSKTISDAEKELEDTEDIFAINYQKEIDKATGTGNYRLAVRLHFLQLLRNLADRNIIQYKQDRTNLDYMLQLDKSKHYADFFKLTRHYEYSWYGLFAIDETKYTLVKKDFESFYSKLI